MLPPNRADQVNGPVRDWLRLHNVWTGSEIAPGLLRPEYLAYTDPNGAEHRIIGIPAERTPPTIFPPWVTPENPGGKQWGQGGLVDAPREARMQVFFYDISGLTRVTLHLRTAQGERRVAMTDRGPYPCETSAPVTARYFTADLPPGLGDLRYFLEAEDERGNRARGSLERVFLA